MEFRSQKAFASSLIVLALGAGSAVAGDLEFGVRHDHWRKFCQGRIRIGEQGIAFSEAPKGKKKPNELHDWNWDYDQIQQLTIEPKVLRVLTYEDVRWKLGSDREMRFVLTGGEDFLGAYWVLRDRLDQRLVAGLAEDLSGARWKIPVKLPKRLGGSHGELLYTGDRLVYRCEKPGESRTWRIGDIENVASSGPFDLSITTHERARQHYGSRKDFTFQLKQPLAEDRYNELWMRVNQDKGLRIAGQYRSKEKEK